MQCCFLQHASPSAPIKAWHVVCLHVMQVTTWAGSQCWKSSPKVGIGYAKWQHSGEISWAATFDWQPKALASHVSCKVYLSISYGQHMACLLQYLQDRVMHARMLLSRIKIHRLALLGRNWQGVREQHCVWKPTPGFVHSRKNGATLHLTGMRHDQSQLYRLEAELVVVA